jgi:DNA-binding SARP family transcriptional activator
VTSLEAETVPAPPASSVAFEILGPVRVLVDGRPVEVGGTGPLALLACLVLEANRLVPVDALVEAIWGDEEPPSARRMVRMYAGRVRRALGLGHDGVPALVAEGPGFRLAVEPESVDAFRFERLVEEAQRCVRGDDPEEALRLFRASLALWRGPALAGLPFAAWMARRLGEVRIAALEGTVEARIALGEHAAAIGDLEQLLAEHPLRERLHALLMTALYRAGRQSDALAHFKAFRRTLVHDLGVEPGTEVRELERAILRQDPALDAAPRRRSEGPALAAPAARPPRASRRRLAGAAAVLALVAVAGALLLAGRGGATLGANAVGVVDARSGKLLSHVDVGTEPSAVLPLGGGRALVATESDRSVALVDLRAGRVVGRYGTGFAGGRLIRYQALLHRTAVLSDPDSMQLAVLDLDVRGASGLTGRLHTISIHVPYGADGISDLVRVPRAGAVATAQGWLVEVGSEMHYEWEQRGIAKVADTSGPLTYAQRMVWMAPRGARELVGFNIDLGEATRHVPLPSRARAVAAAGDELWAVLADGRTLLHFKASTSFPLGHVRLPGAATVLRAAGADLWVGTREGLLLRVHGAAPAVRVVARLRHPVAALAVQAGRVTVAVR